MKRYLYIATDIEADGPIPGDYSMVSLGSTAFSIEDGIISSYSRNIKPLSGAKQHPKTMHWWELHKDKWNELQKNQIEPILFCEEYLLWLEGLGDGHLIFTSDYVGFDLQFVRWYLVHFMDRDPFWISQLDLMSYASAMTKRPQPTHHGRNVPSNWLKGVVHDHSALNDSVAHAKMALAMMKENTIKEGAVLHEHACGEEQRD